MLKAVRENIFFASVSRPAGCRPAVCTRRPAATTRQISLSRSASQRQHRSLGKDSSPSTTTRHALIVKNSAGARSLRRAVVHVARRPRRRQFAGQETGHDGYVKLDDWKSSDVSKRSLHTDSTRIGAAQSKNTARRSSSSAAAIRRSMSGAASYYAASATWDGQPSRTSRCRSLTGKGASKSTSCRSRPTFRGGDRQDRHDVMACALAAACTNRPGRPVAGYGETRRAGRAGVKCGAAAAVFRVTLLLLKKLWFIIPARSRGGRMLRRRKQPGVARADSEPCSAGAAFAVPRRPFRIGRWRTVLVFPTHDRTRQLVFFEPNLKRRIITKANNAVKRGEGILHGRILIHHRHIVHEGDRNLLLC